MPTDNLKERKQKALKERGTLNPGAEAVRDPAFLKSDFLDARDLVQVKYEMLRRVSMDGCSVTETVDCFGMSRPTYYRAQANFERDGLAGLIPDRRGPRGPHKFTAEVGEFLKGEIKQGEDLRAKELADRVELKFGRRVHPRTIERGLERAKKKRRKL